MGYFCFFVVASNQAELQGRQINIERSFHQSYNPIHIAIQIALQVPRFPYFIVFKDMTERPSCLSDNDIYKKPSFGLFSLLENTLHVSHSDWEVYIAVSEQCEY